MTTPFVSVLVAAWNAAGSIGRALASVLDTREVELECVVVDDGSTDGTADVVRAVAATDPRVVLIALERNEGVSAARNRGLAAVRGEWLTLLDADDRFVPGGLALLARVARAAPRDGEAPVAGESRPLAVVGQQVWTDGRRRWLTPFYDIPDIRRPGRTSLVDRPGLLNFVSPHAKLLHRSTWDGLAFEGRVLGDQAWVIRALVRAGDRVEVVGDTVYEWHRPATGPFARRSGGPGAARPPSITTTARSEVQRGLEAIDVAKGALAAVGDEARQRLRPAEADGLLRAYTARLLAMDVAPHIGSALGRSDPEIGRLFEATGRFLEGLPRQDLAGTDALARSIVELPLRRWWRMPRQARAAFWRLVGTALAIDPHLAARGSSPPARLALRLATRGEGAANRAAAAAILMACRLASGARRLVAGAVRGALSRSPVAR